MVGKGLELIILKGTLLNIFETPKGKNKEGEEYGGDDKIQVLHEVTLKNGEKRMDIETLSVQDSAIFKDKLNQTVTVPILVSVYQNKVHFRASI